MLAVQQTYPERPPPIGALMLGALLMGGGAVILFVTRWRRGFHPAGISAGAGLAVAGAALVGAVHLGDWHVLVLVALVFVWPASKLYRGRRTPTPRRTVLSPPPPVARTGPQGAWQPEPPAWRPPATPTTFTWPARTMSYRLRAVLGAILALLIIGARYSLWNHHASTSTQQTIALAFADAIVAFEHDSHRPPLLGTPDWPVPLNGPVSPTGHAYLARIPEAAVGYTIWQTRSRSGSFPSPESAEVPVIAPPANRVIQYVPYGRTWDFDTESYGYEGYLVLVKPGDAARYAEASGDPPTVRLP
jgi:hypothetical protein